MDAVDQCLGKLAEFAIFKKSSLNEAANLVRGQAGILLDLV